MTKFIYNGRIYNPVNLEKKLKKMGISINDIEIIPKEEEPIEMSDIKLYHFKNEVTGEIITSMYNNLDHLKEHIDITSYNQIL